MHDIQRVAATSVGQLRFLIELYQGESFRSIPLVLEEFQMHGHVHAFGQLGIALQEGYGLVNHALGVQISQ